MSIKFNILTTAGAMCFAAGLLTAPQAWAQHDSPLPLTGKFIQAKYMDKTIAPGDDFLRLR